MEGLVYIILMLVCYFAHLGTRAFEKRDPDQSLSTNLIRLNNLCTLIKHKFYQHKGERNWRENSFTNLKSVASGEPPRTSTKACSANHGNSASRAGRIPRIHSKGRKGNNICRALSVATNSE